MFIDKTYFEGEIYLPANNRDASVGVSRFTQSASQGNLEYYISVYEEKYLKELLGIIYPVFKEELLLDSIIPRRDELFARIYGKKLLLTENGNLMPEIVPAPFSPAAFYIYYYYMRFNRSQTSFKGEVRANIYQAENLNLTASQKLSDIYNRMVEESINIQHWLVRSRLYLDVIKTHAHDSYGCLSHHGIYKFYFPRYHFHFFEKINSLSI